MACSAGSACHSVSIATNSSTTSSSNVADSVVSDVLKAMKIPTEFALGTLRLSFGRHSTTEEITSAAEIISDTVLSYWKDKKS